MVGSTGGVAHAWTAALLDQTKLVEGESAGIHIECSGKWPLLDHVDQGLLSLDKSSLLHKPLARGVGRRSTRPSRASCQRLVRILLSVDSSIGLVEIPHALSISTIASIEIVLIYIWAVNSILM